MSLKGTTTPDSTEADRRQHRRLCIRLPLECYGAHQGRERALRTVTTNISTGGLYFEMDLLDGIGRPAPRDLLAVELTVPPGDGHFPYAGRLSSTAEVVRCDPLAPLQNGNATGVPRVGVAARFSEALRLAF